ncbi:MAG TPA: NAD-dependent epimerase/dehydratase family protein [Bryobacteraceae bacterium]|jgi:uncharacterized protein YbjT (DUF2867 family)|nr:NAD-dependent epimerase/dehydratase family protein [Bryobacteraceae bacterium]
MAQDTALLVGATGLVGAHCLQALLAREEYQTVIAFTRRSLSYKHPRLIETIVDFDRLEEIDPFPAADVYCALGSTIKRAGSQHAFLKIDYDYPRILAERSAAAGAKKFTLVSSVGADPKSSNFYLRVKAELERAVAALPFESVHIFRPSFLIGKRAETRLAESAAVAASRAIQFALAGKLRKYRPIRAEVLGAAMPAAVREGKPGRHIYHYDEILSLAARS